MVKKRETDNSLMIVVVVAIVAVLVLIMNSDETSFSLGEKGFRDEFPQRVLDCIFEGDVGDCYSQYSSYDYDPNGVLNVLDVVAYNSRSSTGSRDPKRQAVRKDYTENSGRGRSCESPVCLYIEEVDMI